MQHAAEMVAYTTSKLHVFSKQKEKAIKMTCTYHFAAHQAAKSCSHAPHQNHPSPEVQLRSESLSRAMFRPAS